MPRANRGRQLSAQDAAEMAGMSVKNWHGYRSRGVPTGNPIPDPDGRLGNATWWWERTVRQWMDRRPGSPVVKGSALVDPEPEA